MWGLEDVGQRGKRKSRGFGPVCVEGAHIKQEAGLIWCLCRDKRGGCGLRGERESRPWAANVWSSTSASARRRPGRACGDQWVEGEGHGQPEGGPQVSGDGGASDGAQALAEAPRRGGAPAAAPGGDIESGGNDERFASSASARGSNRDAFRSWGCV